MERESNHSVDRKVDNNSDIQVGHRIEILKERGFVRFIGSLETPDKNVSSLWVGIEWDNPARGKHEGTYKDKKYFQCKRNKGSFIKLVELEKNPRKSFIEALLEKYCFDNLEEISLTSNKFLGNKEAQFVGLEKAANQFRKVSLLKTIVLSDQGIFRAGDELELKKDALASVEILDLSSNLLSEFSEILAIVNVAPSLRELVLSNNRFEHVEVTSTASSNQVHLLVMNDCFYDFEPLLNSLMYFPCVEELHLSRNGCNYDFARLVNACPQLKSLFLDSCHISSWEELAPLGTISSLKKLSLAGNHLSCIHVETDECYRTQSRSFEQLEYLNLSGNRLKGLRAVDELAKLPALKSLRIDGLVMDNDEMVPRFQLIGRLGQLQYLNGSFISESERRDAEMTYIKYICGQMIHHSVESPETAFPRFEELRILYADYFHEKLTELKSALPMKHVVITLKNEMNADVKAGWTRKLPCSIPLRKLKQLAAKQFQLKEADQLVLYYQRKGSEDDCISKIYLEDDFCPLSYYGIENGTTIFMNERSSLNMP